LRPQTDSRAQFAAELESSRGCTSLALRRRLAARAFQETSLYDAAVAAWYACKVAQPL
jgi:phosphoribosylaminoimidazolecarboxamide formyltransferase/IMP cyclohydrolase